MTFGKLLDLVFVTLYPSPGRQEVKTAMRRARAAAFQHSTLNANVQSASLDRIEQHVADPRPEEITRGVHSLQHTMRDMLNDVVGKVR